jgi:signal recognition particle receptor subunit beta
VALIDIPGRDITAKIVLYGPSLSGKSSTQGHMHTSLPEARRSDVLSTMARTREDIHHFSFTPTGLNGLDAFRVRLLVCTVPGVVSYEATWRQALRGVDALVFVADSQLTRMPENVESFRRLMSYLEFYGLSLDQIPCVFQCNKRDLTNTATAEELGGALSVNGSPVVGTNGLTGEGIRETMDTVTGALLEKLTGEIGASPPMMV